MKNFITTLVLSIALFGIFVGLVFLSYQTTPNNSVYADNTPDRIGKVMKQDARPTSLAYTLIEPREPIIKLANTHTGRVLGESTSLLDEPSTYFSTFSSFVPFTDMHYAGGHHRFTNEEIGVCYCGPQALRLQKCLSDLGYFSQSQHFTGCFGRGETTRAIQAFQKEFGINELSPAWAQHGAGDAWLGNGSINQLDALCYGSSGGGDEFRTRRDDSGRRINSTTDPEPEDPFYDLAITKTATLSENGNITYTITVINEGEINSGTYSFVDYLPEGTVLVGDLPDTCTLEGMNVTCTDQDIAPQETSSVTLIIDPQGAQPENYAQIIADDPLYTDIDSTPGSSLLVGEDEDDYAYAPYPFQEQEYDLAITKTNVATNENQVSFVVTVTNEGEAPSGPYQITDYPPVTLFANQTLPSECEVVGAQNDTTVVCSGDNLLPGESDSYLLRFSPQTLNGTNTAAITMDSGDDANVDNNESSADIVPYNGPVNATFRKFLIDQEQYDVLSAGGNVGFPDGTIEAVAGDTVYYVFYIGNPSPVNLYDVSITEQSFSGTGALGPINYFSTSPNNPSIDIDGEGDLYDVYVGFGLTFVAEYTITPEDVIAGVLDNRAQANFVGAGNPLQEQAINESTIIAP